MIHQKLQPNSTSGGGSEKAYGSQSGADKRTDAQNSKKRLHIPPVILKTSLCVIFLTALTAIIVYIKRRRNILWEARLAKRVKKGRYSRVAIMINNRIYKGLGHPSKNRTDELYLANLKEKYCGPVIAESIGTSTCASYKRLCIHQRASQGKNAL